MRRFYTPSAPIGNTNLVIPSAPLNVSITGPTITQGNTITWTTVPNATFTLGVAGTFSFASELIDSSGNPLTITDIGTALPANVTIDAANKQLVYDGGGILATAIGVKLHADNTVVSSGAQADFNARTSGPGVVWFNGFAARAEVDLYRWASAASGNDPNAIAPDASKMVWNASGGPGGTFPHLSITRPAGAAETDTVWWRPLSPFTGASNGKGVNDPGAGVTLQTWAPQGNVNAFVQWNKGWYSQNSAIADGTDFYIQIRVKMDPNASAVGMNTGCKLMEQNASSGTFINQTLVTYLNGSQTGGGPNYNRIYSGDGGGVYDYQSNGFVSSDNISPGDPRITASYEEQIGGINFVQGSSYCSVANLAPGSSANCWAYSGGWDTLLYHITPGSVALTGPHGGTVCAIQVFAAHEGETAYTKIRDQTYELRNWETVGQEGWNALYLASYCNGFNQPLSITNRYAQIILSKQTIPCPQV